MDSLIRIGFLGNKTEDIIMYLSRILLHLGKKVAVYDYSEVQHLKLYVPAIDNSNIINYRGVDIYSPNESLEAESNYDFLLLNYGYKKDSSEDYTTCHHRFIVTDLEKHNIMKLKETTSNLNRIGINRIFRDVVDSKIDEMYINNILDSFEILNDYVLFLDDAEMICRLEVQYNDVFKFIKLPKFYKNVLIDILEMIGFEKKSCIKALKNAERGL